MGLLDSYIPQVEGFEGFTPQASWDYKQYTNGYGTRALYPGEVIDRNTAQQRFGNDWNSATSTVNQFAPNAPDGVKAALSSLTFNAGPKWMNSGLGTAIKNGDWQTAKNIFLQYNHAGGQVNPGLVKRRQAEAQWFDGSVPGRMALGGPPPTDTEDSAPMPGLLSAGSNMAKYLPPPASPIATGSVPPAGGTPSAAGGGLLGDVSDRLRTALSDPLFQFGVGMAGAGSQGKGIGGGLLGGTQNADEAYKTAILQRSVQSMKQRDEFIRSLSDPNNPLSRSLSPQTLAILKGLPPDQAAAAIAPVLSKNAELQYMRQYDLQNMQNIFQMMKGMHGGNSASASQPPPNAKQAADGNYYVPDPNRPGKYLQWVPGNGAQ